MIIFIIIFIWIVIAILISIAYGCYRIISDEVALNKLEKSANNKGIVLTRNEMISYVKTVMHTLMFISTVLAIITIFI